MSDTLPFLSNEKLLDVLAQSVDATAVHIGEQAVIQYANNAMLKTWGKDKSVIGKSLEDALPELKGQPFIALFAKVWNEGLTISGEETPAELEVDGKLQTFYFDYEYRAIRNDDGSTLCILHMAKDVTELVISREREQDLTEELKASNEELMAANEEIRAANEEINAANEEIRTANEEINAANEELLQSQQQLLELYKDVTESDAYFRSMVKQAPIGMCIIRAQDLMVTDVNDAYLEITGKARNEFEGRSIWDGIPEAAETYGPLMNNVIKTGIAYTGKEHELFLPRNGVVEKVFFDFVYEPMKTDGDVKDIMVLAIEVTDKVIARRSIEDVEERIRLAVEAAEIGTFDLDLVSNIMVTSEKFDTIFGFDKHMPWAEYRKAIHPDDKDNRDGAHEIALITGKLFYEVRVVHPDESVHWIRVQGSVYYDNHKQPIRILGTLLDITQVKRLEQQKDDFISIASHELKTPITSLKASLQLLEKLEDNPTSPIVPKLIEQSLKSMGKVSTLVDDLLNVSRSRDSQLQLNKSTFNIAELLEGCCNHVRIAGKHTLTIKGDRSIRINADEHAIDQVIVNFVNNAVKYAPDSLEIFMNIESLGDKVKISVQDTGPGVPIEKVPYLFDRYYQAQPAGFNNSGLGLGLYISSEIIRKHGGEIGVDSVIGEGSTFWFTLPLSEVN
jgi:PAS domain S-box-containing protein